MINLEGKYGNAKVFIGEIEKTAEEQIVRLLNQDFIEGSKVRIMPDVHAGAGCVIGFTADLGDKVIPNLVGVDIGCGVIVVNLGKIEINMEKLDKIIKQNIPSGYRTHRDRLEEFPRLKELHCYRELNDTKRIERSIGTLGGGNHFIEINADNNDNKYLVIHSGSRNLGHQVAIYYQRLAVDMCSVKEEYAHLQAKYDKDLCYLTGEYKDQYLHDMKICQEYATLNRDTMAKIILTQKFNKELKEFDYFHTIHNYIDFADNIIRKGSISAYKDQKVLIPINMRDGSILAKGKGNPDWNYSAPHGAGRLMSRTQAKKDINLGEFRESMEGIYSTSVGKSTLDEAPMAYKSMDEIIDNVGDTIEIIDIIKPIYNFKDN
ncbi:MAG TPA: RtcB family protein [Clostridia bacterium]|nr:RtcB family protein [Clostridia bacterium]